MRWMMTFVILIAVLVATPAAGHEKGDRAMGVVESVTAERIVVETADGHPVAFTITKDTRFFRGDEPVRLEDVKAGQRAVVHGKRLDEELQAVQVKVGASARKR
jgi:hypothetical protein